MKIFGVSLRKKKTKMYLKSSVALVSFYDAIFFTDLVFFSLTFKSGCEHTIVTVGDQFECLLKVICNLTC